MKMDYAQMYFNEPVDAEALGIPQYYEVVKVGKRTLDPCVDRGPSSLGASRRLADAREVACDVSQHLLASLTGVSALSWGGTVSGPICQ